MVSVGLVAVRLDVSVTVTTYVCDPFAHAVESHRNCAEVRFVELLLQHPVSALNVPECPTSLYAYLFTATFDVTGDPSTVKHHFLMLDAGVVEPNARAESVKIPVTDLSAVSDHATAAVVGPGLGGEGASTRVNVIVVLVAVRLDVSVTVTAYVCDPFAHAVESH